MAIAYWMINVVGYLPVSSADKLQPKLISLIWGAIITAILTMNKRRGDNNKVEANEPLNLKDKLSSLLEPVLGRWWGFIVPAILMLLLGWLFWENQHVRIHVDNGFHVKVDNRDITEPALSGYFPVSNKSEVRIVILDSRGIYCNSTTVSKLFNWNDYLLGRATNPAEILHATQVITVNIKCWDNDEMCNKEPYIIKFENAFDINKLKEPFDYAFFDELFSRLSDKVGYDNSTFRMYYPNSTDVNFSCEYCCKDGNRTIYLIDNRIPPGDRLPQEIQERFTKITNLYLNTSVSDKKLEERYSKMKVQVQEIFTYGVDKANLSIKEVVSNIKNHGTPNDIIRNLNFIKLFVNDRSINDLERDTKEILLSKVSDILAGPDPGDRTWSIIIPDIISICRVSNDKNLEQRLFDRLYATATSDEIPNRGIGQENAFLDELIKCKYKLITADNMHQYLKLLELYNTNNSHKNQIKEIITMQQNNYNYNTNESFKHFYDKIISTYPNEYHQPPV